MSTMWPKEFFAREDEENAEEHEEYMRWLRKLMVTKPPWMGHIHEPMSEEETNRCHNDMKIVQRTEYVDIKKCMREDVDFVKWLRTKFPKPKLTVRQRLWLTFPAFCFALCIFALILYTIFRPDWLCAVIWAFNSIVWAVGTVLNYLRYKREARE